MILKGAFLAAGILIALLAGRRLRLQWTRQARPVGPRAGINADGSGRFHALSLRFGAGACDTARRLHGKRILSSDAPTLPLSECDAHHCRCRFVHHRDRRDGEDRRSPYQGGYGGSSTRIERDRRRSNDRRGNAGPARID